MSNQVIRDEDGIEFCDHGRRICQPSDGGGLYDAGLCGGCNGTGCDAVADALRDRLSEVTADRDAMKMQRDDLREALAEMLKRHGSTCHRREFGADRCRYPCQSCDFDARVRKALAAGVVA